MNEITKQSDQSPSKVTLLTKNSPRVKPTVKSTNKGETIDQRRKANNPQPSLPPNLTLVAK